ncbi:hypothetical protein [Marinitenerispora sediminis]|uniref:Uncharacterized protein n=1 Tax=Marinitenerispora sediminis TaxID=1931232 RepID=A0A368T0W5_9ACTN|nr:hypothetical protein [Marinitenerispora sediminis]RCV52991.1 hypothetical protein DEF24_21205 [Marinitenerispora sediminis]RCV56684.1 hypothetical protein DEF28_03150 [Marinitenerispora sediminis]RCV61676.1 hypothetical protein DEF23_01860 [Marinitenerispora sediminis]
MPGWGWLGALLIISVGLIVVWAAWRRENRPRRFFRGGVLDTEQDRIEPADHARLAPEVVEEPQAPINMASGLDAQAAALVEGGERPHGTLSPTVDEEAAAVVDEEVRQQRGDDPADEHPRRDPRTRPAVDGPGSRDAAEARGAEEAPQPHVLDEEPRGRHG